MSDRLEVDAEGLAADGRDLAALGVPSPTAEACPAPASDPVSTSMASALTAHDEGLCQRLSEAQSIREHGGSIVTASGVMFEVADEQGALEISRVDVVGSPRPASAGPPTIAVPKKPEPKKTTAKVPSVEPQSLGPEEFSGAIHSGKGSSDVWDFGRRWRRGSDDITQIGYESQRISMSIDEHWTDSGNNASPKVFQHGTWLNNTAEWAKKLATNAEKCAGAFDTAQSETPTPDELGTAKLAAQMSAFSPVMGIIAAMKYQELRNKAIEAGAKYQTSVEGSLNALKSPPEAPELIAERAEIPSDLTKGPGTWVSKSRREGKWRDYEQQATGFPAGMEYEIVGPDAVVTSFDGYDPDAGPDGLLIESKGPNYAWMVGPDGEFNPEFGPAKDIPDELQRQYRIAEAQGIPVEWRVAEPKAAEAIERIVEREGYDDLITVTVVPPQ